MINPKEESLWIKRNCKMSHAWDCAKDKWTIKISSKEKDVAPVEVTAYGFESFKLATNKAMILFRRNLRNNVKSDVQIKSVVNSEERNKHLEKIVAENAIIEWWPDELEQEN